MNFKYDRVEVVQNAKKMVKMPLLLAPIAAVSFCETQCSQRYSGKRDGFRYKNEISTLQKKATSIVEMAFVNV